MILEQAVLDVKPGETQAFEAAFGDELISDAHQLGASVRPDVGAGVQGRARSRHARSIPR